MKKHEVVGEGDAIDLAQGFAGVDNRECPNLTVRAQIDKEGYLTAWIVELTSEIKIYVGLDGECSFVD